MLAIFDENDNILSESAIGNRILFQGREYDWDTGFYYFRARWYDPDTGRWLSKDPIGISGGLNQYVFCGNNPVNRIDPSGLDWLDNTANFSAGFGDTISFGATRKIRQWMDTDDGVSSGSGWYKGGIGAGITHSLVLGGGRLAYTGLAKGGSMVLLRQGATAKNAMRAVAWRNGLKMGFNAGIMSKRGLMTTSRMIVKYGDDYAAWILVSGRTATETKLFGIPYAWNYLGGYFAVAGVNGLVSSDKCE